MSEWISVSEGLPIDSQFVDVYCGFRLVDAQFKDGCFNELVMDFEGDFDHLEKIKGVTHWMYQPNPPGEENGH